MRSRCTLHRKDDTWLDTRRRYITSTDAAAVMGVDPRRNRAQLLYDKIHGSPPVDNEHIRRGLRMEPHIISLWAKLEHVVTRTLGRYYVISSYYPWLLASPDAIYLRNGEAAILEVKCPKSVDRYREDTRQLVAYRWQVVHQIITLGVRRGILFAAEESLQRYICVEVVPTKEEKEEYLHKSRETHRSVCSQTLPLEMWY